MKVACFAVGWDQPEKEDDHVDVDVYIFGLTKEGKCHDVCFLPPFGDFMCR